MVNSPRTRNFAKEKMTTAMRIVSYNLSRCTQVKINHILGMDADLYILPECANEEFVSLPADYDMLWTGDEDVPQKGLGVIWRKPLSISVAKGFKKIKHHIPMMVHGGDFSLFVLACWPTIRKEPKTYPQLLGEALREYSPYFDHYPAVAMGDFNCYVGQSGVRKRTGTFEDCIQAFEAHGMKSIYHERTGEELGKESEATFFWRFKEEHPYFLDYTFSNVAPSAFEIGRWEKGISDHRPQIMEIEMMALT